MNIEQLRKYCLSFPYTTEDVKWGNDLCFCVGGKMFCVTSLDGSGHTSFKTTPEKFAELTERDGIIPAPYVARYHWVAIEDGGAVETSELKDLIDLAYRLVFDKLPAKVRRGMERES